MMSDSLNIPLQQVQENLFEEKNIQLFILREDLIHPQISGNKWRKLKYNIQEAKEKGFDTILTFGGAFSNHIAATATAGKEFGFKTIGIIRGNEVNNSTLDLATENGMQLKFVSREDYKRKDASQYSECYVIPEGGSNALAVKGCSEIVANIDIDYDIICCAVGTGGTISGIISSTDKQVLGFPALKGGEFLKEDIQQLLSKYNSKKRVSNWHLITDYHFGGYAKIKPELVEFIRSFKKNHNILLDFVYTGKMLFGLYDMIKNTNQFDNKKIVVVHTGGIQGNKGFEERFGIVV
ncbi:MAG: 1-aminocyclopropane-1-carboxylate deaminase [Flavobacteriales bacterium]|nr:MAG: 1-aminocyclopropane-1-carboxylate deaminase [Flavobacteriales bacterium]